MSNDENQATQSAVQEESNAVGAGSPVSTETSVESTGETAPESDGEAKTEEASDNAPTAEGETGGESEQVAS